MKKFLCLRVHKILLSLTVAVVTVISASGSATQISVPQSLLSGSIQNSVRYNINQLSTSRAKRVNKSKRDLAELFPGNRGVAKEGVYIFELKDEALAAHRGSAAPEKAKRLNVKSSSSLTYLNYLKSKQDEFINRSGSALGHRIDVVYQYQKSYNGLAVRVTENEAQSLARLPGVKRVSKDIKRWLHTDVSPDFLGVSDIWSGAASGMAAKGEGIIIGIIDTGINADHPSFAEVGGDGYIHINPLGDGVFLGDCVTDLGFCNNKLIGSRTYPDVLAASGASNGEDLNGHGSHVAATAAGNILFNIPFLAGGNETGIVFDRVAGMAPHANIIAYQTCFDGCYISALVAAIEDAISDGVDVINYSIGGGSSDPWVDADAIAFKNARAAGVIVATSAGNSGPDASTIGSPADAPWVTAVASSTHNRGFTEKQLMNLQGGDTAPPADIIGRSATGGLQNKTIVFAGDYGNALCEVDAFPAGTFNGEIVMCNRGDFALVDKAASVSVGGASGIVIGNTETANGGLFDIAYTIPGIQVGLDDANALRTWLASGSGHQGDITASTLQVEDSLADHMSDFSSRGPNSSVAGIISPSVSAPGSGIYAAYRDQESFSLMQGTSMSSPHVAGSAGLLRQLRPEWSAAEIHSALVTTATTNMVKEDGVTPADPFDMGGGRIQPALAANAGLLMHETDGNFSNADPALGGDPSTLNLPGMQNNQCLAVCSWQRTVKATVDASWTSTVSAPAGMDVTVSPASFSLLAGETQMITVTAEDTGAVPNQFVFGQLTLTPSVVGIPDTTMPIAINPSTSILPETIDIVASRDAGSVLIRDIQALEVSDLQVAIEGLAKAQEFELELLEDTNNGSAFDDLQDGVITQFFEMPADASRFVSVTRDADSESPDLDMFVGIDFNLDGLPSEDEIVCTSATASAEESCDLSIPESFPVEDYPWWVHMQNWRASADGASDEFVLRVGVVQGVNNGNLSVEAPGSIPGATPFDMRVLWDEEMDIGDIYFATIILGSDSANPDNIGSIPVSIERGDDDVNFSVDQDIARAGDLLSFTIAVEPNFTSEDRIYQISAQLPDTLSLLEGSITGEGAQFGQTIFWTITQESLANAERNYVMTSNAEDPLCAIPFSSGGYLDLALFGIAPSAVVAGDNENFGAFSEQDPIEFYGNPVSGGLIVNTNGYVTLGEVVPGASNTSIPNAQQPNALMAAFWDDLEVIADPANGRGVSLATAGPNLSIVEYDDVQRVDDPTARFDFEIAIFGAVDDTPGAYEIMMAYDNLQGDLNSATVGLENSDGTQGTQYLFNNGTPDTLYNNLVVCYDFAKPSIDPTALSFQAMVDNEFTAIEIKKAKFKNESILPWWFPWKDNNNRLIVTGNLSRDALDNTDPDENDWSKIHLKNVSLYNDDTDELLDEGYALVFELPSGKQFGKFFFYMRNLETEQIPCRVRAAVDGQSAIVNSTNRVDNPGASIVETDVTVEIISDDASDVKGAPSACSE